MKYTCIEGPSFAGKSTLSKRLVDHYDGKFVGEYMDYATTNGRTGFPPPPTTIMEAKDGVDFFINIEKERSIDAREHLANGNTVFGDRSVVSLAAYQLALDRQKRHLPGNQIAVPDYTLEAIDKAIEKGDVELPEYLIILCAAGRTVHDARVRRRGETTMGAFNHWFFSQALTDATSEMSELLLPANTLICNLASYEGEDNLTLNVLEAVTFLDTAKPQIQDLMEV